MNTNFTSATRLSDADMEKLMGGQKIAPEKKAKGVVELTAQTLDISKAILTIKAGKLGTIILVHTVPDKGIFTMAQILPDGKIGAILPAHENRVDSNRHLPRAIRFVGSWMGDNGGDEFSNGPAPKYTK